MDAEQDNPDETKLDFSDHEAPTESVLLDDYGVEEAMAAKEVEEPAFVVDEDKRSVQFSDVAGSEFIVEKSANIAQPEPKRAIDPVSIKTVNKILSSTSLIQEKPKAIAAPKAISSKPEEKVSPHELTDEARATIDMLGQHLSAKEWTQLSELIFDVEMEDSLSA